MMLRRLQTATSFVLATAVATLVLTACSESDGEQAGRAPAAAGHGGDAADPAHHRMGRVHRPLRGDRQRRGAGARLRLSAVRQFRRRRDGEGGRRALRHRSAPLSGGGRPGEGRPRERARRRLDWATSRARARARRWSRATPISTATLRRAAAGAAHGRSAPCSRRPPRCRRCSSISTSPRSRAPISGRVSNRRVDIGNLVTGDPNATLLTTIVDARPDLLRLRHERGATSSPISAPSSAATFPRRATTRRSSRRACRTRRTGPTQGTMNFVDNRIDPGSGTIRARAVLPEPGPFHHARPVRAAAHPRLERVRRDPRPRQRHRHRPVEPHRHDGRGGRHGRAEGDPARAVAARAACGSCARA